MVLLALWLAGADYFERIAIPFLKFLFSKNIY